MIACAIDGYHGLGQSLQVRPCEFCATPVCPDHRGLHFELAHRCCKGCGTMHSVLQEHGLCASCLRRQGG